MDKRFRACASEIPSINRRHVISGKEGDGVQVDVLRVIENYYAHNNLYDNREQKITEQAFCFRFDRFITHFLTHAHGSKFDCCTFVLFAADERSNQRVRTCNFSETHLMLTFTVVRTMYTHVIIL